MIISKFTVLCIIISASIPYAKSSFPQTPPLFIRSDFAIGHDIIDIEKGNFNHDDFADIVLLGNGGNITILLGNGDGSLTEAMHSTIGSESRFIHVDDFNNDCISDLVIENALFLSDGSGNFDEEIALDYSGLYSPVTGDVNGDGFTDLLTVVSHYEDEHIIHQLSVALGYGDGTFGESVWSDLPFASRVYLVKLENFNTDTAPDLLITYQLDYDEYGPLFKTSAPMSFFCFGFMPGHGDGSFDDVIENKWYWAGSAVDFSNDGIPDVLGGIYLEPTFHVMLGDGIGNFDPIWESPVADYGSPYFFILDVNGDNIMDIGLYRTCGGDYLIDGIEFFTGTGDGTFFSPVTYKIDDFNFQPSLQTTVVCDVNNDGCDDFIVAPEDNSYVYIFTNSGQTTIISDTGKYGGLTILPCILYQNLPNPFNNSTVISFYIEHNTFVTLDIYDIEGQKVDSLVDRTMGKGTYSVVFNGSDLASGIYFYDLRTPEFYQTGKMLIIK